jgi:uncharacterized protein
MTARRLLAAMLIVAAPLSHAASFDCEKASSAAEKMICADDLLGRLDEALAKSYAGMRASDIGRGARQDLLKTQRAWIGERDRCRTRECLESSYRGRMDAICEYPVISGIHSCVNQEEIR